MGGEWQTPPDWGLSDGERRAAAWSPGSGGGRGASKVEQGGAGGEAAESRGGEEGGHRGARPSDEGGEPEAAAAPERDPGAEGEAGRCGTEPRMGVWAFSRAGGLRDRGDPLDQVQHGLDQSAFSVFQVWIKNRKNNKKIKKNIWTLNFIF